jgi:hypothetical protein
MSDASESIVPRLVTIPMFPGERMYVGKARDLSDFVDEQKASKCRIYPVFKQKTVIKHLAVR